MMESIDVSHEWRLFAITGALMLLTPLVECILAIFISMSRRRK